MTTFNIGSQNADSIQNIGGNMVVQDGIHGTANVHVIELRGRLAQLSEEIDRLALPTESHAVAREASPTPQPRQPRPRRSRTGSPTACDA